MGPPTSSSISDVPSATLTHPRVKRSLPAHRMTFPFSLPHTYVCICCNCLIQYPSHVLTYPTHIHGPRGGDLVARLALPHLAVAVEAEAKDGLPGRVHCRVLAPAGHRHHAVSSQSGGVQMVDEPRPVAGQIVPLPELPKVPNACRRQKSGGCESCTAEFPTLLREDTRHAVLSDDESTPPSSLPPGDLSHPSHPNSSRIPPPSAPAHASARSSLVDISAARLMRPVRARDRPVLSARGRERAQTWSLSHRLSFIEQHILSSRSPQYPRTIYCSPLVRYSPRS